ncbi:MAG: nitroreductase [Bacteroidota bacterium]
MRYNLSEITSVIKDRRSIPPELFSNRKVHREIVENIIRNGTWAPTHGNTQPWRFQVFTGSALSRLADKLAELYKAETPAEQYSEMKAAKISTRPLKTSVIIAICMERQESGKIPEIEEIEAVACAVQNMSLTATAYGIGAFWSTPGITYGESFKDFLGLHTKDRCLGLLYLGYPSESWPTGQRKPIEYLTQWIEE